jgi:uncharacterized protein YheU (UPF0270 family)
MLVAEVRQTLEYLQVAVAYEGTDYGEMLGDLCETAERIEEQLSGARTYVRPYAEAEKKAEASRKKKRRVEQGLESPCEKDGA